MDLINSSVLKPEVPTYIFSVGIVPVLVHVTASAVTEGTSGARVVSSVDGTIVSASMRYQLLRH